MQLRVVSTFTTNRFCTVTLLPPRRPDIFLPFHTFPGSYGTIYYYAFTLISEAPHTDSHTWLEPVEPADLCARDTPCEAGRPLKFHRFITPANPLPILSKNEIEYLLCPCF